MNDSVQNEKVLLFDVSDGVARLTLNRPKFLNAFNDELADAWAEATAEAVGRDDVVAILIQASGRAFCAGGDVRGMAEMTERRSILEKLAGRINEGILSLTQSGKPVVAAAQGATAGGGLGILLCSDYAVVGQSSKVGSLYAGVGLTPDLSVSASLTKAVGERRALQLVLQDRLLTADEAHEWGLVAEVVADDDVVTRAEEIARFWVDNAGSAYGQAKRLVRSQYSRTFEEQLAEEAKTIGMMSETPDAERLIAKFAGK